MVVKPEHRPALAKTPIASFTATSAASLTLCLVFTALSGTAAASAFQILEQSPAHLGRAFAGTASQINDASTVFFNPAGMTQFEEQNLTIGANAILIQSEFNNQGSNTGGVTDETDDPGFVPNLYFVQPLQENWAVGFGINAPFGLASSYSDDWIGRYLATDSELQLINVNATLAYRLNDYWSFGAGLNYQRMDVTLESQIDSSLGVNPDPTTDSSAIIEGDDDAIVADLSVYFQPLDTTSMGLLWRQGGDFSLSGDASFTPGTLCAPGAGYPTGIMAPTTGTLCAATLAALEGDVEADVELPDTLTFSASHSLNNNWSIHGDIAWTQWDSVETIEIVNTENDATVNTLDLQYSNTMRYALGTSYRTEGPWTWRAGIAVDEAPQTDPARISPRIPDQDRVWLSAGFNYALSDALTIDFGYAHLWVDDSEINNVDPQTGHVVVGNFDAKVDIFGLQGNWRF